MSKKNISTFFRHALVSVAMGLAFFTTFTIAGNTSVSEADAAFDKRDFALAQKKYLGVINSGEYSEKILYRLAQSSEEERNYALSLWSLRKIQKEFGGDQVEKKIALLVKKAGGKKVSTTSFWGSYFRFFNKVFYILFVLALLSLGFLITTFFRKRNAEGKNGLLIPLAWSVAILTVLPLAHRMLFAPDLAVAMSNVSGYDCPGFACNFIPDEVSIGELVIIRDRKDTWCKVEVDGQTCWIPAKTIQEL